MRVYVVRHSVPDDTDPDNQDPPLTDEGEEIAKALAQWMLDKGELPNSIYASPKLRTQRTAEILRDAFGLPDVTLKGSINSNQSIRKLVNKLATDKSVTRPLIVSHHETIEHGMRVLNLDPWVHLDSFAMGELRILKVDRDDGSWKEHRRVMPSDLGQWDHY